MKVDLRVVTVDGQPRWVLHTEVGRGLISSRGQVMAAAAAHDCPVF